MKIGDLVQIRDWNGSKPDERKIGTVIGFDVYGLNREHPAEFGFPEQIAEILWNSGNKGWILCSRLEVKND